MTTQIKKDIINESIEIGKKTLHAQAEQKSHDVIRYKNLNFQSYTNSVVKSTSPKLSAFIRVAPFMTDFNKKFIWKASYF